MDRSQQTARAQGRPSDGATTERVAQAAQLFANLTQPGQQRINGDQPRPAGDPDRFEPHPEDQQVYDLLQAALTANERTEKTVELLRHDLDTTISNVKLLQADLAAKALTEKTVKLLRHDLDTTISNVKLLHSAGLAAKERTEKAVELLRHDLDMTISNVKLLHSAMQKALRVLSKRVIALERKRPPGSSGPS